MTTPQSIPATWAFVVAVDSDGAIHIVDHEHVTEVHAKRVATMDDIYASSFIASQVSQYTFLRPHEDVYSHAYLVFQVPDGRIAASMNIFENVVPVTGPSNTHILGAFGVLQGQIIAQKTAEVLAIEAAMSTALKNQADGKTPGGLIRV